MLRSVRTSRLTLARVAQRNALPKRRTFLTPTAALRADFVQDLYLKELKNYKQPPVKPSDAEAHVQKFLPPNPPQSPEESNIAEDLKAYGEQQVEVEGQVASGEESVEEDWFEEDEEEAPAAH